MLVTILGPDGSGKTTLAKSVVHALSGSEYVYLGHNPEQRKYLWLNNFLKGSASQVFFIKPFRRFLITFNDYLEYKKSKSKTRISDRWIIDALIQTRMFRRLMRFYYSAILKFFPQPDLVILLDGDGEKIWKRKKELNPDLINGYISSYKNYLTQNNVKFKTIDTTENSIEECTNLAKNYIHECKQKS